MTVAVSAASFGPRQAQPLDNYMNDAKSVLEGLFGPSDKKDLPVLAQAAIEQTRHIRGIAASLFMPGSDGEELLEALCDATLRRPTFITQMGLPSDQVLAMGQFREGMGAAIFLLLAWIADGRSEQPPQREGESHAQSKRKLRKRQRRPADGNDVGTASAAGAAGSRHRGGRGGKRQSATGTARRRRPAGG